MAGPGLEVEKLETPALALGVAEAAAEEAWQYAQGRNQFGKPICAQQSLAEAQTKLQAYRLILQSAAWKVQQGLPSAVEIVLACQRVLGTYGYAHGFAMVTDEDMPGILNYRYFDTVKTLGHFTEFVLLQPGGEAFFADVPRN